MDRLEKTDEQTEEQRKQGPRGSIRCDYLGVTHFSIDDYIIWELSILKIHDFCLSKITRDGRTDGPTDVVASEYGRADKRPFIDSPNCMKFKWSPQTVKRADQCRVILWLILLLLSCPPDLSSGTLAQSFVSPPNLMKFISDKKQVLTLLYWRNKKVPLLHSRRNTEKNRKLREKSFLMTSIRKTFR